jgi:hypothetical protein
MSKHFAGGTVKNLSWLKGGWQILLGLVWALAVFAGCGVTTTSSSAPNPSPGLTLVSGGTFDEVGTWETMAFNGSHQALLGVDRSANLPTGIGEYTIINVTDERGEGSIFLPGANYKAIVQNGNGVTVAVGSYSPDDSSPFRPAIFPFVPIPFMDLLPILPTCADDPMRTFLLTGTTFSALALDGSTLYLGLQTATGSPAIVTIDDISEGTIDCSQVPIAVDGGPMDLPTDIKVSSSQIFVTTRVGNPGGDGIVGAFDKATHQKLWTRTVSPGFQGSALVVDEPSRSIYVGGTVMTTRNIWMVAKFDFAGTLQAGWPVQPIPANLSSSADMLNAMVANSDAGGGVIAVGCSSNSSSKDSNDLQPTIYGIAPDGKMLWNIQPNVTNSLTGCFQTAGIGDGTLLADGYAIPRDGSESDRRIMEARFTVQ